MKDRIAHIMRAKNLKASDFASLLGIQPSAVSHILAGRNNPSLELVKKIKETFPEYNLDWIIFGTGPMTLSEPYKDAFSEAVKEASLFDAIDDSLDAPSFPQQPINAEPSDTSTPEPSDIPSASLSLPITHSSPIRTVMILYQDGTFESFFPR